MIVWDPNKAIDIGKWSICGGGLLERFYGIYIYIYIYHFCLNNSELKYGKKTSASVLTKDLFLQNNAYMYKYASLFHENGQMSPAYISLFHIKLNFKK